MPDVYAEVFEDIVPGDIKGDVFSAYSGRLPQSISTWAERQESGYGEVKVVICPATIDNGECEDSLGKRQFRVSSAFYSEIVKEMRRMGQME